MDIGVIVCYRPTKSQLNIKVMLIRGHWRGGSYMVTLGGGSPMITLGLMVIYGNIGKEDHIVKLGRRVIYGNTGQEGHIW